MIKSSSFLYNNCMEFVTIGRIINTFGIKGELKLECYSDFVDDRFKKNSTIYIGEDKLPFVMKNHKMHKGFLLIQLKDNEDINLVEKYKGMYVYKSKDDIKPLKQGEYYFSQLKDLDAYIGEEKIGKVLRVEEGISSNYLRIDSNGKQHLVPFLPVFIEDVDVDNKKIMIKDIKGLIWR